MRCASCPTRHASWACAWTSRSAAAGRSADPACRSQPPPPGCVSSGARSRRVNARWRFRTSAAGERLIAVFLEEAAAGSAAPRRRRLVLPADGRRADPGGRRRPARRAVLHRQPHRHAGEAGRHRRRGLRPRSLRPQGARRVLERGRRSPDDAPSVDTLRSRCSATASRPTRATGRATCSTSSTAGAATTSRPTCPPSSKVAHVSLRTFATTGAAR